MRLHNTLTHAVEPFAPSEPGHVRMYVCGPSVYDESHLGHARSYIVYDALKRALLARGLRVTHVQNFTDVEEHIAERARRAGLAPLDHATKLIGRFFEDMDALKILRADHYPRVSEHIEDIQRVVAELEKRKLAYRIDCGDRPHATEGGCDVYLNIKKVKDYGALIGSSVEDLAVDRPVVPEGRRGALDFALWKSRDDWGVVWDSPWGRGRPGWHVECTAMAKKYLGLGFDIHGGGLDLVFPHHENERVIGEALDGKPYCRFYVHNGFVTVGAQKMSKSMGNFVTVRELLARHDAEVLRTFLMSAHYRAPLNYDEAEITAAEARVARWRAGIATLQAAAEGASPGGLPASLATAPAAFWAALEDDLHHDSALLEIDRVTAAAGALRSEEAGAALAFLNDAAKATGLLWTLQ